MSTNHSTQKDTRTLAEKYNASLEAFGRRKEIARQKGSKNECSIAKIAKDAGVDKLWFYGKRTSKSEPKYNELFLNLKNKVNEFRDNFDKETEVSEDRKELLKLKSDYAALKSSIEPIEIKYYALKAKYDMASKSISDNIDRSTEMLAINNALEDQLSDKRADKATSGTIFNVQAQIVCPDDYRLINGRYVFGNKKVENAARKTSLENLYALLDRNLETRLYLLVGLPCSGKSHWAKSKEKYNDIGTDKHPVIFDATNLTVESRMNLVFPIKSKYSSLEIHCIYFDTDQTVIRQRNADRDPHVEAKLDDDELTRRFKELEKPDIYNEDWMDCLKVIRS